jgi:hypothetical protein
MNIHVKTRSQAGPRSKAWFLAYSFPGIRSNTWSWSMSRSVSKSWSWAWWRSHSGLLQLDRVYRIIQNRENTG